MVKVLLTTFRISSSLRMDYCSVHVAGACMTGSCLVTLDPLNLSCFATVSYLFPGVRPFVLTWLPICCVEPSINSMTTFTTNYLS